MVKIIFVIGLLLSGGFFILSLYIFFKNKIPTVIQYFLKSHVTIKNESKLVSVTGDFKTEILDTKDEQTQVLDIAQNYATALLDADSTTILPSLNEEVINIIREDIKCQMKKG